MKNSALKSTIFLMLLTFTCAYPLASPLRAQTLGSPELSDTTVKPPSDFPIAPPPLLPPDNTTAVEIDRAIEIDSNDSIESRLGNEIAIIEDLPPGLRNRISFQEFEPFRDFEDSGEVAFSIQSVVTYIGDEGKVSISISTPSEAALRRNLFLGDTTEQEGIFVKTDMNRELPNQVVFMRGESIITIVSDISLEAIIELVKHVVVR